jgi:hypothetical protein
VRALVEMQFLIIRPSGGDVDVNVRVVGVSVDGGDGARPGEVLG